MTARKRTTDVDQLREEYEGRLRIATNQRDSAHEDLARARAELDAVRATFGVGGPPAPLLAMAQGAALERQHLHARVADLSSRLATLHAAAREVAPQVASPRIVATLRVVLDGLRHDSNPDDVQLAALVIATLLDLDPLEPSCPTAETFPTTSPCPSCA